MEVWRPTTISSPSLERAPLDALAVDEHAVEAAVVEHADAVGLTHDQRVASETVGSSKRTSAARLRPMRVHSRASATTTPVPVRVDEVLAGARQSGRA